MQSTLCDACGKPNEVVTLTNSKDPEWKRDVCRPCLEKKIEPRFRALNARA